MSGYDADVSRWMDKINEQDPTLVGFVDYAGGDYHLDANSSAVGTGLDLSHLFTDDFEGNDRGTGIPFDMGAFSAQ